MTPEQQKQFFLICARMAILNLKAWANEVEMCGVALKNDAITLDDAVNWMDNLGLVDFLPPPSNNENEVAA